MTAPLSMQQNSRPPPARNGRQPPTRGTTGDRFSDSGWAQRPSGCSIWQASNPAAAFLTLPPVPASSRSLPRAASGPSGHVLATDIAPALLEHALADARAAGLSNVSVQELDGEQLDTLPAASFDVVISRVGLIYFPDQQRALKGMLRALAPGGRVAAIVYSTPDRNGFFSIPVRIIRERAKLPPPLPGQPGPFSLGAEGVLATAFSNAGFRDVVVQAVPSPVKLQSAAECVRFERESFGALHQMMSTLSGRGARRYLARHRA